MRVTEEKKRAIELAVRGLAGEKTSSCASLVNRLIETSLRKPALLEHLENCFKEQGCIDKLAILEKAVHRNRSFSSGSNNVGALRYARELFPDRH